MAFSNHWFLPSLFLHLFLIAFFFWGVDAQGREKGYTINPVKNFCSRWWSQSVVKNDMLYIDSGLQKYNGTDVHPPIFGINSYMITIPLNFTWDWKTNIIIESEAKNATNPKTGTLPVSQMRGHMFHGPNNSPEIYLYGGTTYMGNMSFEGYGSPGPSSYPLWSYNGKTNNYPWQQYAFSQPWRPNHGSAAEATDQGLAFYLNGQIDWGTSLRTASEPNWTEDQYVPLDGMVVIDLNTQTSNNVSTPAISGNGSRVGGAMEYIAPVGGNGILVALGGQVQPTWKPGSVAESNSGELIDFSTVDVFDIDAYLQDPNSNGTWYQQKTSGEIPPPRIDFCTVAISAPDNSSHHIYLYGGRNPITNQVYDDVLILTLPSFTWTNVFPIGESPRWGHNCHIAGRRQMITVGGNITNTKGCDWEVKGVAVWEMSTLTWGSVYRNDLADFQVPRPVLEFTGGTVYGKATIKDPAAGWTNAGLQTVFSVTRGDVKGGRASGNPVKLNIAVIAGGVAGGIVGLLVIVILSFVLYRRRRKGRALHELSSDQIVNPELGTEKHKYELAVNENNPAELPGPPAAELCAPREFVELDRETAITAAELPATNVVTGGLHGVPIVRTPGDDLPERPVYTPGLNRNRPRQRRDPPPGTEDQPATRGEGEQAQSISRSASKHPQCETHSEDRSQQPTSRAERQQQRSTSRGEGQQQSRNRDEEKPHEIRNYRGNEQSSRSHSRGEELRERSRSRGEAIQRRARSDGSSEQEQLRRRLEQAEQWPLRNDVQSQQHRQRSQNRGEELQYRSRSRGDRSQHQHHTRRPAEQEERWPRIQAGDSQQRSRSHGGEAQHRSRRHNEGEEQWSGMRVAQPQQRSKSHGIGEHHRSQQRPRRPGGGDEPWPRGHDEIEGGWI